MFTEYERFVREELKRWEQELTQEPGVLERLSRQFSREVNRHIPEKIHQAIAAGIRTMIESIRVGIQFTPKGDLKRGRDAAGYGSAGGGTCSEMDAMGISGRSRNGPGRFQTQPDRFSRPAFDQDENVE